MASPAATLIATKPLTPTCSRCGWQARIADLALGRQLVDAIAAWADSRHASALYLLVTSNNEPAIAFYQNLGFTMTGHTEPYPNDPALIEHEMSRSLFD